MGHSFVVLKGPTAISSPDNLALRNTNVLASGVVPSMSAIAQYFSGDAGGQAREKRAGGGA
jgi:hypothetical protein